MEPSTRPPLTALFLVVFDQKVGYTLAWKRSSDSLPEHGLNGVEFKCLPSGLHSVKEDVVYFLHGDSVGVSAFVREEADEGHRNAAFATVGALVPLSYGRMGRAWMLAPELRRLAGEVVNKTGDAPGTSALEAFWESHKRAEGAERTASESPSASKGDLPSSLDRKRKRARSDVTGGFGGSDDEVGVDHPALCMPELLDTFGPLTFPLFRAALLRKRILFLGQPPVQRTCNFVYVLSILANIPPSLREMLQPELEAAMRIQPLYSVGISDIPSLSEKRDTPGWLACTTDDILGEKPQLYDLLVKMPGPHLSAAKHRWPTISTSFGAPVKATQRDLRRYRLLRAELNRIRLERERYRDQPSTENASDTDATADDAGDEGVPLIPTSTILNEVRSGPNSSDDAQVVEASSWTAMAYNGFLWWASAGEMEAWESEEVRADRALLDDLPEMDVLMEASSPSPSRTSFAQHEDERHKRLHKAQATAMAVTAYFHRLTALMLSTMGDVVEAADDDTEEGVAEGLTVSDEDVKGMGLDAWSEGDRGFVEDAVRLWFGREAAVERGGTRVCGLRIC